MARSWEHFEHEADVGLRAFGASLPEVLGGLGMALTAVVTDPARVRPQQEVAIHCDAPSPELLLVDWLNAIVFEMATRHMLFGEFQVSLHGDRLDAVIRGEPLDRARHEPAVEVKGATYTALRLERLADGGWMGQCVVDV